MPWKLCSKTLRLWALLTLSLLSQPSPAKAEKTLEVYGTEYGDIQVLLFNQKGKCVAGHAAMLVYIDKRQVIDGCWGISGKFVAVKLANGEIHLFEQQDFKKITGSML